MSQTGPKRAWSKEQKEAADRWSVPQVDDTASDALKGAAAGGAHLLTSNQVDHLTDEAKQEGFSKGYAEGLAAGGRELQERLRILDELLAALARPFEELDREVEQSLASVATTLAQHIVRREIKTDPAQILGSVRDCMEVLPGNSRDVVLHLNPKDAALVREHFEGETLKRNWTLSEDSALPRGSLRVTSDTSSIDGRLQTRLGEIVGAALGTGRTTE